MQKNLFTLLLVLGLYTGTYAQQFPYQFSYTNEPYVALTNGTVLDENEVWGSGALVPFGFEFQFGGVYHNKMVLDGYSGALFTEAFLLSEDTIDAILGYTVRAGITPQAFALARHITSGTAPNRIAKVEIYRGGFDGQPGEVSYQIWLHETSNMIQIRLGYQDVPNPSNTYFNQHSPLMGYMLDYHYISNSESVFPQAQFVVGTPASPLDSIIVNGMLDESIDVGPQYGPTDLPLINSVFSFAPGSVSTKQPFVSSFRLSPNPAQDMVRLEGIEGHEAAQVQLLDEHGRILTALELPAGETMLRLPVQMVPGIYLLRYTSEGSTAVSKLIKI